MSHEAFEAVKEFHLANHQLIGDGVYYELPEKVILLRQRLMLEELGELAIATHEQDLEKIADGLSDLLYVIMGTAVSLGVQVGDVWPTVEVSKAIVDPLPMPFLALLSKYVASANDDLIKPPFHLQPGLVNATGCIARIAQRYLIPLRECFFEVHRANMTKRLGGAVDGKKYGNTDPKGVGFVPAQLRPLLGLPEPESADKFNAKEQQQKAVEKIFGRPVFILDSQDQLTPITISRWIAEANAQNVDPRKVQRAMIHAGLIYHWQKQNPEKVKLPD